MFNTYNKIELEGYEFVAEGITVKAASRDQTTNVSLVCNCEVASLGIACVSHDAPTCTTFRVYTVITKRRREKCARATHTERERKRERERERENWVTDLACVLWLLNNSRRAKRHVSFFLYWLATLAGSCQGTCPMYLASTTGIVTSTNGASGGGIS